jgi:hypothetical protein
MRSKVCRSLAELRRIHAPEWRSFTLSPTRDYCGYAHLAISAATSHIGGVIRARHVRYTDIRTEERRTEFRNEFLHGIGLVTKALREVAIETALMARPMLVMPISA